MLKNLLSRAKGMVEVEDIYDHVLGVGFIQFWSNYRPVIEERRKRLNDQDWLRGHMYLAGEFMKEKLKRDPSYKLPETIGVCLPEKRPHPSIVLSPNPNNSMSGLSL